ncbi:hypothetical protein [Streptomyces sp. WAC04114]|uniref:hypothetical protein n=1 Tax=Streptomyces sp. WAC04114 TaxID=2867961 RepID=UPI001C8C8BA6|nr:hypothetical protein [Streptomyces sp. WAC04114]MBX9360845.1 hypothetical protein [Streptomyces sp. WAC04114]
MNRAKNERESRKTAAILAGIGALELACGISLGFLSFPSWGLTDSSFTLGKALSAIFTCGAFVCFLAAITRSRK